MPQVPSLRENMLPLLSLVIVLSAYLATVRGRLLDKMSEATGDKRTSLKNYLKLLLWAEVPLVLSGLLLAWCLGCRLCGYVAWPEVENAAFGTFYFAVLALAVFHAWEWVKTWTK